MTYTLEQQTRWEEPVRVRPVGRGGAVHTIHPDTGQTYCGKPAGRRLTESEMSRYAPHCRACLDGHSALVNRERHDAYWTGERLRAEGRWPYNHGGPKHDEWVAEQVAAGKLGCYRCQSDEAVTHDGFDIAGEPAVHQGPREKCWDPACEEEQ